MFYGTIAEVGARTTSIAKDLVRGRSIHDVDFGPMMMTSEDAGARIVLRRGRLFHEPPQFHPYALFDRLSIRLAMNKLSASVGEECFVWALRAPWSFVGVVQQFAHIFVFGEDTGHLRRAFLEAALRFWDVVEGEGPRYGFPPPLEARTFSCTPTAVPAALAAEGLLSDSSSLMIPGELYRVLCAAVRNSRQTAPWPPS
jgi:hypothetical protein